MGFVEQVSIGVAVLGAVCGAAAERIVRPDDPAPRQGTVAMSSLFVAAAGAAVAAVGVVMLRRAPGLEPTAMGPVTALAGQALASLGAGVAVGSLVSAPFG